MTKQQKIEMMVWAINRDYFGYGSSCTKLEDGKWASNIDGETFILTEEQMLQDWEGVAQNVKKDIQENFTKNKVHKTVYLVSFYKQLKPRWNGDMHFEFVYTEDTQFDNFWGAYECAKKDCDEGYKAVVEKAFLNNEGNEICDRQWAADSFTPTK
jgi:hypothetical protein